MWQSLPCAVVGSVQVTGGSDKAGLDMTKPLPDGLTPGGRNPAGNPEVEEQAGQDVEHVSPR